MKKFQVPNIQEVKDYAKSIDFDLDPERFIDYYEMVGWRVNKQPMKCWKAAVRTWKRNQNSYTNNKPKIDPSEIYAPE